MTKRQKMIQIIKNASWQFAEEDGSQEWKEYEKAKAWLLSRGLTPKEIKKIEEDALYE